jgi:uncharacterized coiled-coil protein SlyX
MFGFGNKKKDDDDKDDQEQVSQAMRNMSDQIGAQAKAIKELEEKLAAASKEAASGDQAERQLREAQAKMRAMQAEMEKAKSAAAKAGAASSAASSAAGSTGVTKIGSKADAPGTVLGGAAEPAAPAPAAPAASGGLTIGHTAFVRQTGGKNLRLRNGPGLSTNAFAGLAPGTSMTLLEGPLDKDGYPWYRIRTVDGQEGWVAGTELVTQPD